MASMPGMVSEKAGTLMEVKNENQSILAREIKIVPTWAWVLALICFVAAQVFFNAFLPHQKDAPPQWACTLLGLVAGLGGAVCLMFNGCMTREAKRRGLSPL